jgi:hypothetical protein
MMTSKKVMIQELNKISNHSFSEILNFIQFLTMKYFQEDLETHLFSESTLAKDWLCAKEEQA